MCGGVVVCGVNIDDCFVWLVIQVCLEFFEVGVVDGFVIDDVWQCDFLEFEFVQGLIGFGDGEIYVWKGDVGESVEVFVVFGCDVGVYVVDYLYGGECE